MTILHINAVKNADNTSIFSVVNTDGSPFDLTAEGVTEVFVRVCDRLNTAEIRNVTFMNDIITVVFGDLDLPPGNYKPKIMYINPDKPDGEIIVAECFKTQINLKLVC